MCTSASNGKKHSQCASCDEDEGGGDLELGQHTSDQKDLNDEVHQNHPLFN